MAVSMACIDSAKRRNVATLKGHRHCSASDEAIRAFRTSRWIASLALAMTAEWQSEACPPVIPEWWASTRPGMTEQTFALLAIGFNEKARPFGGRACCISLMRCGLSSGT